MEYRRIEIAVKPELDDPFAHHVKWEIASTLGYTVHGVRIVSVYTVYSDLSEPELLRFARDVLNDPVLTFFSIGIPIAQKLTPFMWALEVSFKAGVTDNVGNTALEVLNMMSGRFGDQMQVYKSTQYLINADLVYADVEKIGTEILYNALIEDIDILHYDEFIKNGGFRVKERHTARNGEPQVKKLNLHIPDKELMALSERRTLALNLNEMEYFRSYFDRADVKNRREAIGIGGEPTDVELEAFAQTQSEHCKHKIFNAVIRYTEEGKAETIVSLFNTYIRSATSKISKEKKWLKSVFKDNAGVIQFNEDYNLAFKVETHNSPSALDPYGGAITGIVGCDRDPAGTGVGSRLIAHTDVLCFGDPEYAGELPPRMMHPKRIMEGVIKGIEDGGNKCGIPTVNGGVTFDHSYSGKPLVFCGSVGIMPENIGNRPGYEKLVLPGDVIVMVGGRIGKDGIHGATFSSEEIKETSPVQAVQIGDPITQKKMLDMLLEARDMELYHGITDNGAGGLSSSVGEMAQLSGGALLELEKAPLKYPGLDPWEILLSEAQERMTLAVPKDKLEALLELARRRDVLATPIGAFTDSGYFHVTYRKKTVCYMDLEFLHSDIPLTLEAQWEPPAIPIKPPHAGERRNPDLGQLVKEMVSDLNSCSREPIIRRYDHEVGGATVVKPLVGKGEIGPSDGGVIAPLPGEMKGFVLSSGINPFYSRIDTYHMAACCVDEAVRNAVTTGADPEQIALLDNFCWPDPVQDSVKTPDGRYKLAQLVRAARGLYDTALAYGTPFISGKDSMKNDYKIKEHKVSVLPTILISAIGVVPDIRKCITSDFKHSGDIIYLIGETGEHMGESLYYRKYGGRSKGTPVVDPTMNMKIYRAYYSAVKSDLIASGHDLSEGGLAIAVAESCIAGNMGAELELECQDLSDEIFLFSESTGRILISINPHFEDAFLLVFRGLPVQRIGRTIEKKVIRATKKEGSQLFRVDVTELTDMYRKPLYRVLGMKDSE